MNALWQGFHTLKPSGGGGGGGGGGADRGHLCF